MERRGLVFLLLSGCVLVCQLQTDGFIRRFHAVSLQKTWTDAQRYCRDNFIDLATIQNAANNSEALQVAGSGMFWIGLFYNNNWRWTQDNKLQTGFTSWAQGEPKSSVRCVTISGLGTWTSRNCGYQYFMMCYSAEYNKHVLVKQLMNRSDAQTYCRSKYTDLSSVRTLEDNKEISSLLQDSSTGGGVENAWIGLFRWYWLWSDLSSVSYMQWADNQPDGKYCMMMSPSSADWYNKRCDEKHPFICEEAVRLSAMKSVKVWLSGGPADLNDPVLQDTILQQLKQKLEDGGITEDVTLRWRKQPDGKIFHREEEGAPGDREEAGCDGLVWTPGIN